MAGPLHPPTRELKQGITLTTSGGHPLTVASGKRIESKQAAKEAVAKTVFSRVVLAIPGGCKMAFASCF